MSKRQEVTAVRVANVPAETFEAASDTLRATPPAEVTPGDKRKAILLALKAWGGEGGKSDNQIAAQVGCSQVYVWRIHQELITSNKLPARETVKGQDGRVRPATRTPKAPPVSFP